MNDVEMVLTQTYKTMNYGIIKEHDLQPTKRVKGYQALANSLKITNGNAYHPLLVSEKTMQLVDGHRRYYSSIIAGTPIYYVLLNEEEEAKIMTMLNTTSRNWTSMNFIEHHSLKNDEYEKLYDFLSTTEASIELVKLFANIDLSILKEGGNISNIDYEYLHRVLYATSIINAIFKLGNTFSMRSLKKVVKLVGKDFDINKLLTNIGIDAEKGRYRNLHITSNQDMLQDTLLQTYKRRK